MAVHGIRAKILAILVLFTMLFGLSMILFAETVIYAKLHDKLREKVVALAHQIAADCISPMITERYFEITMLLKDLVASEQDIVYAYVLNESGRDVAHTFERGFPEDLKRAHEAVTQLPFSEKKLTTDRGTVHDIAVPLLRGQVGVLHLGVSDEAIVSDINDVVTAIVLFSLAVLVAGVLASIRFSRTITKPLVDLAGAAEAFGRGEMPQRFPVGQKDEIGGLARSFQRMTGQLRDDMEELEKEIAERVRTEGELEKALKKAEDEREGTLSILESISDGISIQDRSFRVLYQNQAHKDLMGSHAGEYCYRAYQKRDSVCAGCHLERTFGDGRIYIQERTAVTDTGAMHVEITSSPVRDSDGAIIAGIEMVKNITERKKNAALIRNILENVDEGFIVVDRNYRILMANRTFSEKMKISPDEALTRHCYEVSHRADEPCFEAGEHCAVHETFETGEPAQAVHRHFDAEGREFIVETKAFPLERDVDGNVITAIETLRDITAEKKLEEQLRQSQKMEAVGHLAGGIAHDFNNILMAVIGYADMMRFQLGADHPQRGNLDQILSAANRAAQLTQNLLAFSRKQIINLRPENLNGIIQRARKLIRPLLSEAIGIEVRSAPEPLTVLADSVQIEHVLMNLATNARDAMTGEGTLTIETRSVELDESYASTHGYGTAGTYALIAFSDTGKGMDDATRARVFEPFYTTKEVGKGTGLGLSMAYGIVKQHDGFIDVYSEAGKGTTFKIYLPLHRRGTEATADEPGKSKQQEGPRGGREMILLAEDDESVRTLVSDVLRGNGYRLIVAVDGEDAVRKFMEHKDEIRMLLSDVVMPRKNGRDVYAEIRKVNPGVKALFISGYTEEVIAKRGIIDEGLKFISKPIAIHTLLSVVREVLDA